MEKRLKSIDSLRGVAILMVLLIHTTTRSLEASGFDVIGFSWTLFLNQIARFAVPLFFILSGFVLELSYKEEMSFWSFVKRRFSRIFIPYLFWSGIYYLFVYTQNNDNFFRVILTGNASYQLYFIPTLCIFYLMFPFLHRVYKFISNKAVLPVVLGTQIYLLNYDYNLAKFEYSEPVRIAILSYFFFLIGMVAARNVDRINTWVVRWKTLLPVITFLSGLYVFWEGKEKYLATGNYLSYYSQWRPSILIYTLLAGLSLYYFFEFTGFKHSIVAKFSKHSFFVFFVHVAVLESVWFFIGKNLFDLTTSPAGKFFFDPIFFGIVSFTSFLTAFILHKIPKSERVLG